MQLNSSDSKRPLVILQRIQKGWNNADIGEYTTRGRWGEIREIDK